MPSFKFPDPDGHHVSHASPGTKFVDTAEGTSFSTRKFEMISCNRAYDSQDPYDCHVEHGRPFDAESIGQAKFIHAGDGIKVMYTADGELIEEEVLILPADQKKGMPMNCTLDDESKSLTCNPKPKET